MKLTCLECLENPIEIETNSEGFENIYCEECKDVLEIKRKGEGK